ncbi:MAG: hypothetical protein FJZ98_09600, partial [Chloroflexi bacterium]|nr:hypothetical protein [Chloroflexota bacterium]
MKKLFDHFLAGFFLLAYTVSACQPQPLSTQESTASPTVSASVTDQAPEIPEHRIGIRQVNGEAEFFEKETGEIFIPRGANYVYVPVGNRFSNLTLS